MDRPLRRLLVIGSLALGLLNTGCRKEPLFDGGANNSVAPAESKQARSFGSTGPAGKTSPELAALRPGAVLFSLNEEEQRAQDQAALARLSQQLETRGGGGGTGRPGLCPRLAESTSAVKSATLVAGSFCDGTAKVAMVYDWYTLETFAFVGSIDFDFLVKMSLPPNTVYACTYALISSQPQPGCVDMGYGECPVLKHFVVTLVNEMDAADYGQPSTVNVVTATSSCVPNPEQLGHTCSLDFPETYYTGNPARVVVTGSSGFVSVLTECSLLCPPPHILCPTSGTFDYVPINPPGPPGSATISSIGDLVSLPAGDYTYSCTLDYSFGTSLPQMGAFTVN